MWDIGGGKKRENKYCLHPNYVNNKYTADGEPQTSEPLQTPKQSGGALILRADVQEVTLLVFWRSADDCEENRFLERSHECKKFAVN